MRGPTAALSPAITSGFRATYQSMGFALSWRVHLSSAGTCVAAERVRFLTSLLSPKASGTPQGATAEHSTLERAEATRPIVQQR